jgi:hypothetical protein
VKVFETLTWTSPPELRMNVHDVRAVGELHDALDRAAGCLTSAAAFALAAAAPVTVLPNVGGGARTRASRAPGDRS